MRATASTTTLSGVGEELARRLERLGIRTVVDLVTHFPHRYEDWQTVTPVSALRLGQTVVIKARARQVVAERSSRRRLAVTRAQLTDETGSVMALWFGQPWLANTLKTGLPLLFRGKVGRDQKTGLNTLVSPTIEYQSKILAVYPETEGISSKRLRQLVTQALAMEMDVSDGLPPRIAQSEKLMDYAQALREIHTPTSYQQLAAARLRLGFGELFNFLMGLRGLRAALVARSAPVCRAEELELRAFASALPFSLTDDQRRVAWEVIQDMGRSRPMHRLLQGDVGSGKTVVAAFAAYVAAKAGFQTIWMAPTEILARQHHQVLKDLLAPFGMSVGIHTGAEKSIKKTDAAYVLTDTVTIGTHALIRPDVQPQQLGLVVIDEQHRFGVAQRELLEKRTDRQGFFPHVLSMSATPIPRSLALSIYADLDVSLIRQKPAGRRPIRTRVLQEANRPAVYKLIDREITAGRQVYVVCPLIDTPQAKASLFTNDEVKNVIAESERLGQMLPTAQISSLHGRQGTKEKNQIMAAFAQGKLDILVATTVIEVGVDVPNATVMLIEGANHFGLSQLHQLRGRIGRGQHQSYCLLISDQWNPLVAERLTAMERTDDGLKLAEIDLSLRGPGELVGFAQSGLPTFRVASLFDLELVRRVRRAVDTQVPPKEGGI